MVAGFLTPFMGSSINVALPQIGKEFSMGAAGLGWVAQSFLLASAMLLVPAGRLADIYGRKKIFLLGMAVLTLGTTLCALAPSEAWLIVFRVLQGLGGAMAFGTSMAIVTSVFPPGERGRAIGMNVAAVYLGLSLGPVVGGVLTEHFGWRSLFAVIVPLGALVIFLASIGLKREWADAKGEKFDLAGSVLYSLSLLGFMLGFSQLKEGGGALLAVAGLAGLALFVVVEARTAQPIFPVRLFRENRAFTFSNLAALINYAATAAVGFLLSLYLQSLRGYGPKMAGLILICQPVMQVLLSPLAGKMSDKIEPRIVASFGMALTMVGLGILMFLQAATPIPYLVASLVFLGTGFALFSSPNTNAVMSSVDKRLYGVASATLGTMRMTGQMLSMGLIMLILTLKIGQARLTPEVYGGFMEAFRLGFGIFTALCFGGIFASLARGRVR
jgi:EmrB/QacA subfamily drug resistance transporter